MNIVLISYALTAAAAFFCAMADTIAHHFHVSIFNHREIVKFHKIHAWFKSDWRLKYENGNPAKPYRSPIPWLWDGWHNAKENMILSFLANTVLTAEAIARHGLEFNLTYWNGIPILAGYIAFWYFTFNIFYKKIFLLKGYRKPFFHAYKH